MVQCPRFREMYAFLHNIFDDDPVNSKVLSLAHCQSSLSRHEFLVVKAQREACFSPSELIYSLGRRPYEVQLSSLFQMTYHTPTLVTRKLHNFELTCASQNFVLFRART